MPESSNTEAATILEADPDLQRPEHAALAKIVQRLYQRVSDEVH